MSEPDATPAPSAPAHARKPSDIPSEAPSSARDPFGDPQTRDYVASMLRHPPATLATAAMRADFAASLLGPADLAKEAEDDVPLLRQLEARVAVLVSECEAALVFADAVNADALVALLALVAASWPVLLEAMERCGATLLVVSVMRRFRERASVVARAMTALRAFTVTDAMRKRVMFDGGMDITLELMSVYRTHHRVQDRAAAVIANVAFGCTHRKRRIARQGAVRKIIDGMATFPNDENIQLRGALTIRNLTHEAQVNQYIAGNEGAVEAISSTLLRFRGSSTNPELRFQCVLALESLCREDERNRQRVADIDNWAISNVDNTAGVVDSLPKLDADGEEENVNEDGDIVVDDEEFLVPDVTPKFRHGAALCPGKSSLKLIISPSASSSGCSDKTAPSLVLDESKLNIGNENGGEEKPSSAESKPNQKRSIIRAIVHAMRRDPDDALLLETALSLLTLIALHRGEVQTRIGDLGGVHVAIAAIRRHSKSQTLVAKACALIRCLCFQEANRSQVTSGLPVLISAAREHWKDADVVREVASALSNAVFEHEKNRAWVVNKGGVDAIVRSMNSCGRSDVMVLEAGICALRNFVDSSYGGALAAANEGAVRAAVNALDSTKEASSTGQRIVQEQAVLFLVDVARLAPQTTQEMIDIDAADWIENALAKLSLGNYEELHAAGDKLTNALTNNNQGKFGHHKKGSQGPTPPSPTAISGKAYARGLFGAFSLPRRAQSKGTSHTRRRPVVRRSMPITSSDPEPRIKWLSARMMKNTALS